MIEARVPAFHQIVAPRAEIVTVLSGMGSLRGIVCSRTGFLYFADVATDTLYEYVIPRWQAPDGGTLRVHPLAVTGAFGLTLDHQGRLLIAHRDDGRVSRVEVDGSLRTVSERGRENAPRHPCDIVYAIDGSIYVTDLPARDEKEGMGQHGGVYQISRQGRTRLLGSAPRRPAAVALDCRQLTLYVAERADRSEISCFPISADGRLKPAALVFDATVSPESMTGGLKTDEDGNIFLSGPDSVWVYNRDGVQLGKIGLPEQPRGLSWGRGFKGLYVTARSSIYFIPIQSHGTRTF